MAFLIQEYDVYLAVRDKIDLFRNSADALRSYTTARCYLKATAKVHILQRRKRYGMLKLTRGQCIRDIQELLKSFDPTDDDPIEDSDSDELSVTPTVLATVKQDVADSQATVLI
jgi:hypothetical protein